MNEGTSKTVNNDKQSILQNMERMSLGTATSVALPPSSPDVSSPLRHDRHTHTATATTPQASRTPLHRTPSAGSLNMHDLPSPLTLHKKTSLSSLTSTGGVTPPRSPVPRRPSSYFHNLSMGDRSSLPPPAEEPPPKPPLTAASVARVFFERELEVKHGQSEISKDAQTVVVLQDACYGHRYSRPRTSRATLSTIVERPERIHASLLGVSSAYVRLGGRHAGGRAAPHPSLDPVSLPPAPFKIVKTSRTVPLRSPAVTAVHGAKWMDELVTLCEEAETKLAMNGKELTRTTSSEEKESRDMVPKSTLHEGDLYLCSESLGALEGALGGVCTGVDAVFGERGPRRAFVCIRPPGHHCSAHLPSGFCWLNNVHVGIQHAILTHGLTHAAIIDFDLHHGDGSQSIAWAHNARVSSLPKNAPLTKKAPIGYFSLHDINSYPCEEGDEEKVRNASVCLENAHGQSIWNVHLHPWKTMSDFWSLYEDRYLILLAKARAFMKAHSERLRQAPAHPKPKGAIFLSSGFDASEWEGAGMQRHQVNVPTDFFARFTRDIIAMADEEALGVDGRVISVLEGGYSDRALMSGVLGHLCGMVAQGQTNPSDVHYGPSMNGIYGQAADRPVSAESMPKSPYPSHNQRHEVYDPAWWAPPALEEIENLVNPPTQAAVTKGQRSKVQPTFTSPTESSIAKVLPGPQGRRSLSGNHAAYTSVPRRLSPPPPDVGWASAASELCNLLVPSNRNTRSCKPEDLNAEASRKRRDRVSGIGLPSDTEPVEVKQLPLREKRTRAVKPPVVAEELRKPSSRGARRKTVADVSLLNEAKEASSTQAPLQRVPTRRRSSVASSIGSLGTLNTSRASEFRLPSVPDQAKLEAVSQPKKTRGPAPPTAEIPKARLVKRPTTTTRTASTGSAGAAARNGVPPGPVKAPLTNNSEAKNKDVDQLTAGLKGMSIKLHVPPREEYEARQAKLKPAPRGRPPKTTVPKVPRAKSPKTKTSAQNTSQAASTGQAESKTEVAGNLSMTDSNHALGNDFLPALPEAKPETYPAPSGIPPKDPLTTEQATISNQVQVAPPKAAHILDSSGTPGQPHPETTNTVPPNPPDSSPPLLPTSPPPHHKHHHHDATINNNENDKPSTPITVKRMTKSDLPVFTATSPISFGRPASKDGIGSGPGRGSGGTEREVGQ